MNQEVPVQQILSRGPNRPNRYEADVFDISLAVHNQHRRSTYLPANDTHLIIISRYAVI